MGFFWRKKTIRIIKCTGQLIYVTLYIDFSLETIVKNQAACVTSHFDFTLEKCGQKPDCIEVACCYCCCRIYFTWLVVAGVDWWCRIWSFDRNLRLSTSAADLWSLGSFYRVQVSDCGSSADVTVTFSSTCVLLMINCLLKTKCHTTDITLTMVSYVELSVSVSYLLQWLFFSSSRQILPPSLHYSPYFVTLLASLTGRTS